MGFDRWTAKTVTIFKFMNILTNPGGNIEEPEPLVKTKFYSHFQVNTDDR